MSRDPSAALARALARNAETAGAEVEVLSLSARDWISATFAGAHHRLVLAAAPSDRLDRWLASLCDLDLPVPGQLLADMSVRSDGRRIELQALTIQDAR